MINLGTELYAHRSTIVEIISTKVNTAQPVGIGFSTYRGGITTAAKISTAALLFDLLFKYPGHLSIYQSTIDDGLYVEINGVSFIVAKNSIRTEAELSEKDRKYYLVPHVLYSVFEGSNEELTEVFESIIFDYMSKGDVDKAKITKFCDSYYYGTAKYLGELEEGNINIEEVKAGARSGLYKIQDKYPTLSKFTKESSKFSLKETKEEEKEADTVCDFLQECKDGKYRVAYEWPEEMKPYIKSKSFLDNFEATQEFEEIVRAIKIRSDKILERMDMGLTGAEAIGDDKMNFLLLGKPGTGKTTIAYAISAATGMPVCTTAWNKHSDEDEEEGKTKIIDGAPSFVRTDALKFHINGGIDINEEINLADPSVTMGCLGQKLEYPYIVKENGYNTIVRHPLNIVIAAMNVGTEGSNPLNQALANRFPTPYILDDPTKDTFINILIKSSKQPKKVCKWVYEAYEAVVDYLKSPTVNEEDICNNLSIRTCLGAIQNMKEGQSANRALINSIVGSIAVVDLNLARRVQKEKIDVLTAPPLTLPLVDEIEKPMTKKTTESSEESIVELTDIDSVA